MLPRRVFHAKPGSGSGVRLQSEVVNTASVPSTKNWTIQDISDRILDTSRSSSEVSLPDIDIPPAVKVSRQVPVVQFEISLCSVLGRWTWMLCSPRETD